MACYIVSYDLKKGSDYEPLYAAIKAFGTWAHITESTWAVVTEKSAVQLRDHLATFIQQSDRLFVVKSGTEAAWRNSMCDNEWLKKHL